MEDYVRVVYMCIYLSSFLGESWKKKWRTLRDTYVRKKKLYNAAMSEDEARKVEKWCFLDMMGFLDKYTEGAR